MNRLIAVSTMQLDVLDATRILATIMTIASRTLAASVLIVAVLNIFGAIDPAHANWGYHLFGFYPPWTGILALALAVSTLFPFVRRGVWKRLVSIARVAAGLRLWMLIGVLFALLVAAALLVPAKLHLLGDGALLLRVTGGLKAMEDLPPNFNHQPLVGVIFGLIRDFASSGFAEPVKIFQILDGTAALLFILLFTFFLRHIHRPPAEVMTYAAIGFLTAGSQFFFGYVELYAFFYIFTFGFLLTGWLAIEEKVSILIPVSCYVLMVGLHFGSFFFLPAVGVLLVIVLRKKIRTLILISGGLIVLAVAGYATGIFRPEILILRTIEESRYNFLPLIVGEEFFPYTMLSWNHFIDWLNALLLIAPFGVPVVAAVIAGVRREVSLRDPLLLFLATATLAGLVFTFIVNPALGLARDWDFLATFFVPLIVLNIYLARKIFLHTTAHDMLVPVIVCQMILTAAWIGVNGNADRHLDRVSTLGDRALLGVVPRMNFNETMANYYWYSGRPREALPFWEQYAAIDSANPRTMANLSEVYRKLGDAEGAFRALRTAAVNDSRNPAVYMNLGVMYANRGDTVNAIAYNMRALEKDSTYAKAHANLGLLYTRQSRFDKSVVHLERAVQYGLQEPFLYRELGSAMFFVHQYGKALEYYDIYLEYAPGDQAVRDVRNRLEAFMRENGIP